jgi:hypothetical protein
MNVFLIVLPGLPPGEGTFSFVADSPLVNTFTYFCVQSLHAEETGHYQRRH